MARDGTAASLPLLAADGWSPRNHELFPSHLRALAWELLKLGTLLASSRPQFAGQEQAFLDAWKDFVMHRAIRRCTAPRSV